MSDLRIRRVTVLYYTLTFLGELAFTLPIWVIFGHDYLGLSYLAVMAVFTVPKYFLGGILQVPCGAWADSHGRKAAYLIGTALSIAWLAAFVFTREFWAFVVLTPLTALGAGLCGGSLDAIMSSVTDSKGGASFRHLASNRTSILFLSRVIASSLGGLLYTWDPRAPVAATLIATALTLPLGMLLPGIEPTTRPAQHHASLVTIVRKATRVLHEATGMWTFLALYASYCVAGEVLG